MDDSVFLKKCGMVVIFEACAQVERFGLAHQIMC